MLQALNFRFVITLLKTLPFLKFLEESLIVRRGWKPLSSRRPSSVPADFERIQDGLAVSGANVSLDPAHKVVLHAVLVELRLEPLEGLARGLAKGLEGAFAVGSHLLVQDARSDSELRPHVESVVFVVPGDGAEVEGSLFK